MKKTMFDVLEKTPEGVDENTLEPAYKIDPEKVMKGVHQKLSADKKKGGKTTMKKSKRKLPIILAAAVISALAIGTLTVGALGGINSFIGEHSAGEMINSLYPGSDASVTTTSSMKGEFIGITGDDTNMVSLVRLKNTDGSDIIEPGKNGFIESNDFYNYYNKTSALVEEEVVDINMDGSLDVTNLPRRKTMIWHQVGHDVTDTTTEEFNNDPHANISHSIWFRDPFDSPYPAFVNYEMADSKTINCYISSHIDSGLLRSLKGETLKADDKNIYVYQIDKVLYQAESAEDYVRFVYDYDRYNGLISENIHSLRDDQVITAHGYSMVVATRKVIDIDMNVSVKLNYKSNTKQLTPPSDTFKGDNGVDYTIGKITVGSLSTDFELNFQTPEGKDEFETFTGLMQDFDNTTVITLTNGKFIYAQSSINHNYWEHHTVTLTYSDSDDNNAEWVIVNPEEIQSIQFRGVTINA